MYADYEFYNSIYKDKLTLEEFGQYSWEAERRLDNATTGLGYRKLREAFPTDKYDAECVKRCMCELVHLMKEIDDVETAASDASGYMEWEDGTITPRIAASRSAGSESISFNTGGSSSASGIAIDAAVSDYSAREQLFNKTIHEYLSGVKDARGVSLLFMGEY